MYRTLSKTQKIGWSGEDWFVNQAVARGYKPELLRWESENCDLKINGLPIEVKFAHPTYRFTCKKRRVRWQWRVHPTAFHMAGDWALVLIAQDSRRSRHLYIMPGSVLQGREHIQLTSHPDKYRGWINQWKDRWDVIDFLSTEAYKNNGPLLEQWEMEVAT